MTYTDINGEYTVLGAVSGSFTANFSRYDYVTRTVNGSLDQSQFNKVDVQLSANGASIGGTVTDQLTGAPVAGAEVTLTLSGIKTADVTANCNGAPLSLDDGQKVLGNDGIKYSCNNVAFKARKPDNTDKPFAVTWNGIGAILNTEYLAQRFKPTRTGALTKVSIDTPGVNATAAGEVHVLLKAVLGGDRGTYIAKSNGVSFATIRSQTSKTVEFTFPEPPPITAGQEYYLEINGTYYDFDNE